MCGRLGRLPPQGPPPNCGHLASLLLIGKQMSTCPRRPVFCSNPRNCHRKWLWTAPGVVSTRFWGPSGASILAFSLALKDVELCNCRIFWPFAGVDRNISRVIGWVGHTVTFWVMLFPPEWYQIRTQLSNGFWDHVVWSDPCEGSEQSSGLVDSIHE